MSSYTCGKLGEGCIAMAGERSSKQEVSDKHRMIPVTGNICIKLKMVWKEI